MLRCFVVLSSSNPYVSLYSPFTGRVVVYDDVQKRSIQFEFIHIVCCILRAPSALSVCV